ncbi:hypothetical protein OE88DRAFT_660356 [Heliocybe sulcata]|uniref:Uncharacterized protein n=1 Tax=Heliocybe sulcata TaxID=5364 RepID=A0A5C3ND77_9AGAM|nr:hypothetical protein OE88DRAFT_660356 [Heliocybe sulcata]
MCVVDGSVEQAISTCPMCKVYKPSGSRCPHKRGVCRNEAAHPGEVVYLKNAEVQTFNGCGYCKWAETNPPPSLSGSKNPGWPGCCRPPGAGETKKVPAADWIAVSTVHHIPIPAEIKALLERVVTSRSSPLPRVAGLPPPAPSMERKNSGSSSGSAVKATVVPIRTAVMGVASKPRSGSSPKQPATSLTGSISRATAAQRSGSPGAVEQRDNHRHADKRHESPGSKPKDLEGSVGRRGSARRPSVSAVLQTPTTTKSPLPAEEQTHQIGRSRSSTVTSRNLSNKPPSPPMKSSEVSSKSETVSKRSSNRRASLGEVFTGMEVTKKGPNSASSESGGSSNGSLSDSTVTSEGFTDYLSDESEAEIQRQAEKKAAQVAQNHMEELEFKTARLQLANVGLRPPKSWNPSEAPKRNSSRA